ncbi:MAG TPA: helix-turn-helix transcriptional regulator [Puia sp.]
MGVEEQFSQLASLIGEPARAKMLWNLLDGRAFTATELSLMAEVSPQSASMHLNKLMQAALLTVQHQGRHRYYQLASREVAYAIEAIANLLPSEKTEKTESFLHNGHIKYCRSCYDHLAGKIGVAITDKLVKNRLITPEANKVAAAGYKVTSPGLQWFLRLKIDVAELKTQRRIFSRQCLDWSERRPHLAGSLGAALLTTLLKEDWIRKINHSRALLVTGKGEKNLYDSLGLTLS